MSSIDNYLDFRQQYEAMHPASVPVMQELEVKEYPSWVGRFVGAAFFTSASLSGVHTVPTVYDTIQVIKVAEWVRQTAALMSLVAVESSMLGFSYMLFKKWSWWVFSTLATSFLIAMFANLYSISKTLQSGDNLLILLNLILGIGMPLIALSTGKVYVSLHKADRAEEYRVQQEYQKACKEWDAQVERAWKQFQKTGISKAPEVSNGNSIGIPMENIPARSTLGHSKDPDASKKVRAYLDSLETVHGLNAQEVADHLGVGKSTVYNILPEYKKRLNGSSNGNGHH